MILNTGKCHYMCVTKDAEDNDTLHISSSYQMNSKEEEILRITIDRKLTF